MLCTPAENYCSIGFLVVSETPILLEFCGLFVWSCKEIQRDCDACVPLRISGGTVSKHMTRPSQNLLLAHASCRPRRSRRRHLLRMPVSFESWIRIRVRRTDECEVNALSSCVLAESFRYKASFFDGVLKCCVPDVVELLGQNVRTCFLREEVRLYRSS